MSTTRCGTTRFPVSGKPCYLLCISHRLHGAHEPNAAGCIRVCNEPGTRPMVPNPLQADPLQLSPPAPARAVDSPQGIQQPRGPALGVPCTPGSQSKGKSHRAASQLVSTHVVTVFSWTPIRGCVSSECFCCQLQTSITSNSSQQQLSPACKTPGSDGTAGCTPLPTQKPTDSIP